MRILIDTLLLADSALATGCVGPSGLSLNGQSIVDEVAFYRAAALTFFERGGESIDLQFRVQRHFDSARLAEKFVLTHRNDVPRQGRLTCTVGSTGDTEDIFLEDAIVQPSIVGLVGQSVVVNYAIRGGIFSTDVPDPLPSADPEEDEVSFRRGSVAITAAAETVDVVFSSALASAPTTVIPRVSNNTGDDSIDCYLLQDTITASGFTVTLSAPAGTGQKLHYIAFL